MTRNMNEFTALFTGLVFDEDVVKAHRAGNNGHSSLPINIVIEFEDHSDNDMGSCDWDTLEGSALWELGYQLKAGVVTFKTLEIHPKGDGTRCIVITPKTVKVLRSALD
jgi:hypothetical protein